MFFDVAKAYNMLWKDGPIIKLDKLGINGKLYNWVLHFLNRRTIDVKVGAEYSSRFTVDNAVFAALYCSIL